MACRDTPETLWRLPARYDIPTFIFINKIDLEHPAAMFCWHSWIKALSEGCLDANGCWRTAPFREDAAALDEAALESFLKR